MEIPYGYCQCGCGNKSNIAKCTDKRDNIIKGQSYRFLRGHHMKLNPPRRENSPKWNGGERITVKGRIVVFDINHPRANNGYVYRSILVVEKAMGKSLKQPSVIHHIDGVKTRDKNDNLVVCQDQAYHLLLHQRHNAYKSCGHANWRKCWICKEYDDPKNLYIGNYKFSTPYHKNCLYRYDVKRRQTWKKNTH